MTIDDHVLDPEAAAVLQRLMQVAAHSQARAPKSRRTKPEALALDIIQAFRNICHVEPEIGWTPRHICRVQGRTVRAAFVRAER